MCHTDIVTSSEPTEVTLTFWQVCYAFSLYRQTLSPSYLLMCLHIANLQQNMKCRQTNGSILIRLHLKGHEQKHWEPMVFKNIHVRVYTDWPLTKLYWEFEKEKNLAKTTKNMHKVCLKQHIFFLKKIGPNSSLLMKRCILLIRKSFFQTLLISITCTFDKTLSLQTGTYKL